MPTILFVISFLLQGDYEMVISDYGRAKSLFAGTDIKIFKRGVLYNYSYLTEFLFPLWKNKARTNHSPLTGHDKHLGFVSLLMSSPLTKIGIICAQVLQEETIFPLIPRSECSAEWSLKYAQKYDWRIQSKNCLQLHMATPW